MTPALAAIPGLTFATLCYVALCAASPYGKCRKCDGLGFAARIDRRGKPKRGKTCRRCKGTGHRIRIGRLLYNHAARLHRDGTN